MIPLFSVRVYKIEDVVINDVKVKNKDAVYQDPLRFGLFDFWRPFETKHHIIEDSWVTVYIHQRISKRIRIEYDIGLFTRTMTAQHDMKSHR